MLSVNSYMFRHRGAIFREFHDNKVLQIEHLMYVLVALSFITKIKN
jgi:hypothetical protein